MPTPKLQREVLPRGNGQFLAIILFLLVRLKVCYFFEIMVIKS